MNTTARKMDVNLPDPTLEIKESISHLQKQQKILNSAMVAIIAVVALGFISVITATFVIFIDYHGDAEDKYDKYIESIKRAN